MCGRFSLTVDPDVVQLQFLLDSIPAGTGPRFNIAPTQPVLTLTNEGGRDAQLLRWGLIPFWAKDPKIGSRMINARAETLAQKPSFKGPFKRQRCVIFADGFFEWKKSGRGKTPMYIQVHEGQPFALAGLWESWQPPGSDEALRTCTIITTEPNEFMASIHDRMPVILPPDQVNHWLTPGEVNTAELAPLLKPYNSAAFSAYEVSRKVNSPANDTPEVIAPVPAQPGLF